MASDNISPIRPDVRVPPPHRSFDELQIEMMDWLKVLSCGCTTLAHSDLIDHDETTSRARAAAHACNANLHRLMNELEHRHAQRCCRARKPSPRPRHPEPRLAARSSAQAGLAAICESRFHCRPEVLLAQAQVDREIVRIVNTAATPTVRP